MFARVHTAYVMGIEGIGVEVEVDVGTMGLPSFAVVGLAEGAVKESRDRVKSALRNMEFNLFARPITINLAPADFRKEGTHFDLPIAIGLIAASTEQKLATEGTLFIGELSLDGNLRGVSGVLPIALAARKLGFSRIVLPADNKDEAALVKDIAVYGFSHLSEVLAFLNGTEEGKAHSVDVAEVFLSARSYTEDFADVKGQFTARRAAEIAAAGMHNILFIGTPGSGKTMIARRIPTILPDMTLDEALVTTKVHSVAGMVRDQGTLVATRPFISPHHTASDVAIIGGGAKAMPGHVSLATNGVLFLDEMLEFNRSVLEVLRQPLEDGQVTIARAGRTVTYPANFMLVSASNPCPCGYLGDTRRECSCAQSAIQRYRSRLSGPLLDRIDLHVQVSAVDVSDLSSYQEGESSAAVRERVQRAHDLQRKRFAGTDVFFNSSIPEKQLRDACKLSKKTEQILENAMRKFSLSARAYGKILKTGRTIADLDGADAVDTRHVLEALQYRMLDSEN